jgi:ribosomal protein S18 acetylase RimI-like enzyme
MHAAITIDEATPDDCRAVAQIHVDAWRTAYRGIVDAAYLDGLSVERREANWRQAVANGPARLLVARGGDALLGWVSFGPCRDAGADARRGEIWAIYVAPAAWSRGVGRRLLQAALAQLRLAGHAVATLWVMSENARAIRFYRALGFRLEPGSEQTFQLGGQTVREARMAIDL